MNTWSINQWNSPLCVHSKPNSFYNCFCISKECMINLSIEFVLIALQPSKTQSLYIIIKKKCTVSLAPLKPKRAMKRSQPLQLLTARWKSTHSGYQRLEGPVWVHDGQKGGNAKQFSSEHHSLSKKVQFWATIELKKSHLRWRRNQNICAVQHATCTQKGFERRLVLGYGGENVGNFINIYSFRKLLDTC